MEIGEYWYGFCPSAAWLSTLPAMCFLSSFRGAERGETWLAAWWKLVACTAARTYTM